MASTSRVVCPVGIARPGRICALDLWAEEQIQIPGARVIVFLVVVASVSPVSEDAAFNKHGRWMPTV